MKNAVLTVLAIAAFGVTGVLGYRYLSGGEDPTPENLEAPGVCVGCKQEVTVKHKFDAVEPFTCTACGKPAVFKWRYCNECHRRFVPKLVTNIDTGNAMVPLGFTCPACSCADVNYFMPDFPGQLPIGDAELPKWPPPANGK